MSFDDLTEALKIFGLSNQATLDEIRKRYRALAREHHPDHGGEDPEKMGRINLAYKLLRDYCANYRFTFSLDEYLKQNPEERMQRQFYDDPVWGGGNKKGGE
ncbi:MAG: molecular chaperone DnaJ [Desulfuromonas sp.]|nr:MAG: molecular chaperone DnaJ [Desulfuromonas sp.]